jgi:hypothetical protein
MLKCVDDVVMTIKSGHRTTGNTRVILSDELAFTQFLTSGRVYVWRTPKEAYNPQCMVPTVKHREGSMVVWAAILWYSILLVQLLPFMAESLQGGMWTGNPVHPMMQFSKMTIPPFTQLALFSHGFKCMKVKFNIFPG